VRRSLKDAAGARDSTVEVTPVMRASSVSHLGVHRTSAAESQHWQHNDSVGPDGGECISPGH
jgi:hypothetical protein